MKVSRTKKLGTTIAGNRQGRSMVITHGWGTDSTFLRCFEDLFPEYKLIFVDMPGYGKSRHLKRYAGDPQTCADMLLKVIPHNAILISWSLSTLCAVEACIQDTEHRIESFISICGTPRFPCDPNWPGFDYKYVLKCQQLFQSPKNQHLLRLFFAMQTQGNSLPKELSLKLKETFANMKPLDMEVLHKGLMSMAHSDLRQHFFSLKIPCLHIFGLKDNLVKAQTAKYVIDLPYHNTVVFQNSAHMPFLTEPQELQRVIRLHLNSSYLK